MSILKIAIAALISILPINMMRVSAYRILLGYDIRAARIGFGTVIAVEKASIQSCKLGVFNLFTGPMKIMIGKGASIGDQNTFACGNWVLREEYRDSNYSRSLEIGVDTLITSRHYFDVAGTVAIGERSWIAGIGSQFWTHGVGVVDRNIEIGRDCYLGSAVRFAPGSSVGNNVLVAMGSVVSSVIPVDNALVGGVPAKVLQESYDWKSKHG